MKIPWGSWLGSMLPKNKFKGINILVTKKYGTQSTKKEELQLAMFSQQIT